MDPQTITLLTNTGALGVVLVIYLVHILPAQKEEAKLTREAIKDAATVTAAATDRNTVALEKNTTVTAGVGERLTYLEGTLGIARRAPSGPVDLAHGSRDSAELAAAREAVR